jgi:hypothetical protein
MDARLTARRVAALVTATAIAVGCAARQSEAPTGATPVATAAASPSVAAASPVTATPSAKPSVVAARTLDIRWTAHDPTGLSSVRSIVGVARNADRYVLVAELPSDEREAFAAWTSEDGQAWKRTHAFPDDERVLALTAGGPGFVVAGFKQGGDVGVVWTSNDGLDWQRVTDASLQGGVINQLVTTASGVVGFGWRYQPNQVGAIWTSPDGFEWLAATNATGVRVARGLQTVSAYDGRAVAFVSEGERKPAAIWETTGRAEWTRTGTLPDVGIVERVAGGMKGWVAIGSNKAWASTDGRSWSKGVSGPDVAADVIVDDAGFVAVGFVGSLPGETCGDQRPFEGHTWTSVDGRGWRRMPITPEFKQAMVLRLLVTDRTLIGFGHRIGAADTMSIARWTAPLPELTRPADKSDKPSVPESCGG